MKFLFRSLRLFQIYIPIRVKFEPKFIIGCYWKTILTMYGTGVENATRKRTYYLYLIPFFPIVWEVEMTNPWKTYKRVEEFKTALRNESGNKV